MFTVEITDDAKAALQEELRAFGEPNPCVVISREGPTGDVSRSKDGSTVWKIERPEIPWRFDIGSFTPPKEPEYLVIKGIRVWLSFLEKTRRASSFASEMGDPQLSRLAPNSALLTDASSSLRCACGAAKRGR